MVLNHLYLIDFVDELNKIRPTSEGIEAGDVFKYLIGIENGRKKGNSLLLFLSKF